MSIYTQFTPDDIVEANPTVITTGLWSGDTGSLETTLYLNTATGQQVDTSSEYYLDVYDKSPSNESAEVQFSIAYGHISGSGAPTLIDNSQASLPTKAIYSQYRNLLLDPSDTKFTFQGVESDHIYVINFQRARIREQLDPGNWELPLSGAGGMRTFIDDSGQTLGALTANSKAGRVFNIVSGALNSVTGTITAATSSATWGVGGPGYGLVYPDLGIIILNPNAIGPAVGFFTTGSRLTNQTGSVATGSVTVPFYTKSSLQDTDVDAATTFPYAPIVHRIENWNTDRAAYNHAGLYYAIKRAVDDSATTFGFKARSAETISSTHYYVRLRNKEYNYSNNPTFYNPNTGALTQADFRNNPVVYFTTVGLYNAENELLAVAKVSKPIKKSFNEEALLRVRLDF